MRRLWYLALCILFTGCGATFDVYYTAPMTIGLRVTTAVQPPATQPAPTTQVHP